MELNNNNDEQLQTEHDDIDLDNEIEAEDQEIVEPEPEVETVEQEQPSPEAQEEEELVISIGDEKNEDEAEDEDFEKYKDDPEWFRKFREEHRKLKKEIRKLKQSTPQAPAQDDIPKQEPKPTLESCEYDEEVYESKLAQWYEKDRIIKQKQQEKENEFKKQQEAWNNKIQKYESNKKDLKVSNYDDYEDMVKSVMSLTQQGIIVKGAKNPAKVVYVLGRNPSVAKKLSEITDPIEFSFAIADLESQLKTNRKAPPPPEKVLKTGGGSVSSGDAMLKKLEEEAERTGDRTKVIQYNREKRKKSA